MKTYYIVELDGIPIEVFSSLEAAKRIATERTTRDTASYRGKKARVAVVRHWYYDDETTPIQLEFLWPEWPEIDDTNPEIESISIERESSSPNQNGSCAAGIKSDCGCTETHRGGSGGCG